MARMCCMNCGEFTAYGLKQPICCPFCGKSFFDNKVTIVAAKPKQKEKELKEDINIEIDTSEDDEELDIKGAEIEFEGGMQRGEKLGDVMNTGSTGLGKRKGNGQRAGKKFLESLKREVAERKTFSAPDDDNI